MAPQTPAEPQLQEQQNGGFHHRTERALQAGIRLAHPPPGEEVVVTGMAGRFPESDDVYHYRDNLFNKVDMVTNDNRRWDLVHSEIPERSGKINLIEKFDAGFFGVNYFQASALDVSARQLLERAFEAIVDAGFNPEELRGTRTGVFMGSCITESEKTWFYDRLETPNYGITGCTRSIQAQWISRALRLTGPSHSIDTACSSSMTAFEHGYRAIREGKCDSALVGAGNLCLHPMATLQFSRLGVLSKDGSCKSFDEDANGYARSEAVSVVYLQKAKDARRIYAQAIHAKLNCDGYKEQGITFPSGPTQKQLLSDIYQECQIDPTTIDFLEAHATGTKVGDPEEITAMDEIYCKDRKVPLFVGSVKSNHGHTEPTSGVCSIIKVLLSMENNCLIPNISYTNPKIDPLKKGRLVVVTEKIQWPSGGSGLAAVNNFGFGGANGHVLLKRYTKRKVNRGEPSDNLPRLVCVSGRTEEAIGSILDNFRGKPLDAEFVRLLHAVFGKNIEAHPYRGYAVLSKTAELSRSLTWFEGKKPQLCLVFSSPNENLLDFGNQLFTVPLFVAAIQKIHNILSPKGIYILDIISKKIPLQPGHIILGSIAVQIALADILNSLDIHADYIIGYSLGEVPAAYADGTLSLEQAILVSYHISDCLNDINYDGTVSYLVELNKNTIQTILPRDIEIVGHNSKNSYTISGPPAKTFQFANSLASRGIVVKEVKNDLGLHSKKHFQEIHDQLLQRLKQVLVKPKRGSRRWISTSLKDQSKSELENCASAEYLVNNLRSPVLFDEAISVVPRRSVMLEIGSRLIQKQDLVPVLLTSQINNLQNGVKFLLCALGRLYELGYNPSVEKFYPKVHWPVSVNTPMLSPLIKWNHSDDWYVALYKTQMNLNTGERKFNFSIKENDWAFVVGHVIDGRNLLPATGYLTLVWETFAMIQGLTMSNMQVVFENVRFNRATNIPKTGSITLFITVQKATGAFEVAELGEAIVTGRLYVPDNFSDVVANLPITTNTDDEIQLTTKDIYKELKLRGYHYTGAFRGLKQCDLTATKGLIEWTGNWVAFMDNMLQIKILQEDTRSLYVPTFIEQLAIDARAHLQCARKLGENPSMPVYVYQQPGIIKAGAIEIRGLMASSIPRRKPLGEPVLETYKFIPFETELSLEQSVRVHSQIILENNYDIRLRAVEILDEATRSDTKPIAPIIQQVLGDQPLIQPDITVLSKEPIELENLIVKDRKLAMEGNDFSLVVASGVANRPQMIKQALGAIKENGFILSRENLNFKSEVGDSTISGLSVIAVHSTGEEKLVLLRKAIAATTPTIIDISNDIVNFNWLPTLQAAVRDSTEVLLIAQNEHENGILGLVNCLRREPEGSNVRCIFIMDKGSKFHITNNFYVKQVKKGLVINVLKNGKWGTYRHLLLGTVGLVQSEHVFNNVTVKGDLSSLRWLEGPLTSKTVVPPEKVLVHIYYAALNFRDIMTASGRISSDVVTKDRLEQGILQGFEFSGRDSNGKRVMGMIRSGALASMVAANSYLVIDIPDEWSMEDAATVPVTYCTVLHSLIVIGRMKPYQSILIHAGTGGVGQSAINVALYYKCNIFTTVGSQEKRDFIRRQFPQIPESHIGNSRDTSFEQMVFEETEGRGVDLVLNSLAEEKLQASVRCLAPGGRFLEIGKFDLESNHTLDPKLFTEGRSYSGVMLDVFFDGDPVLQNAIGSLLIEGLKTGCVRPLNRTVFKEDEVEHAFRYMAGGKHMGKVVINLRQEESQKNVMPKAQLFSGMPRFYCNPNKCYVIAGGLGGFGMELADWLVLRGAKKLVLISRQGLTTGYQASRIRIWKSYGVTTRISTTDITTKEGCVAMIKEVNELGPVEGIFNLAVVLKDALLENLDTEKYITSLAPKAVATKHLDEVTRKMCPELQHFVVFSSVSCGRGNVGQTNYGMANSIMERICEQRKADGYPALAIQWGAIGEVGLVADMQELQTEIEIGGTLQQRISSCIEVMDTFLRQDEPIVSSMVVAEKRGGLTGAHSITEVIMNIMGIRDIKSVGLHTSLSQLGMDSIMAVEIKQTLEREYEAFLTAQDIRGLTLTRLQEIANEKESEDPSQIAKIESKGDVSDDIYMFIPIMGDEEDEYVPIVKLPSLVGENGAAPKVFLLPGLDGTSSILEPLAGNLTSHAFCLQFPYSDRFGATIDDLAKSLLPHIKENLTQSMPFTIVAYSFSSVAAMHLVSLLENEGRTGRLILVDGSPEMCKQLILSQTQDVENEATFQTLVLCALMKSYLPLDVVLKHKDNIFNCNTFEDRVNIMLSCIPKDAPHSEKYQRQVCMASYLRIKSVLTYKPTFRKLQSIVQLFKPSQPILTDIDYDYQVNELCEHPVEVTIYEGNHLTILRNPAIAHAINKITDDSDVYLKQTIINNKVEVDSLSKVGLKQI